MSRRPRNPGGTCQIKPGTYADVSAGLTGTWNGNTGAIVIVRDANQFAGTFSVANGTAVTGSFSAVPGAPAYSGTFACTLQ